MLSQLPRRYAPSISCMDVDIAEYVCLCGAVDRRNTDISQGLTVRELTAGQY